MSLLVRPVRVGGPEYLLLLEEDLDERVVVVDKVVHGGRYAWEPLQLEISRSGRKGFR